MASVERAKYLDRLEGTPCTNRLAAPLVINPLIQMLNLQRKMLSRFSDVFVQFKIVLNSLPFLNTTYCVCIVSIGFLFLTHMQQCGVCM